MPTLILSAAAAGEALERAARLGTSSSINPGASCPSDCANGPTGSDQWELVLVIRGSVAKLVRSKVMPDFGASQIAWAPAALRRICHVCRSIGLGRAKARQVSNAKFIQWFGSRTAAQRMTSILAARALSESALNVLPLRLFPGCWLTILSGRSTRSREIDLRVPLSPERPAYRPCRRAPARCWAGW
jgi:hypothetical protein